MADIDFQLNVSVDKNVLAVPPVSKVESMLLALAKELGRQIGDGAKVKLVRVTRSDEMEPIYERKANA